LPINLANSRKVAGNAIGQNLAVFSENMAASIKIKTENGFNCKRNVCIWGPEIKYAPANSGTSDIL